jgi:hypothetical protein
VVSGATVNSCWSLPFNRSRTTRIDMDDLQ